MHIEFEEIENNLKSGLYHRIGSGSGRDVYDLENGYVIKIARNKKGIAQNKAEHQISLKSKSELLAEILTVSNDYKYLIMIKAERVQFFSEIWNYFDVKSNRQLFQLTAFRDLIGNNELLIADLIRKSSWGLVQGRPVIVDFGFTRQVRKLYRFF